LVQKVAKKLPGVSETSAREAAEELAAYDSRLSAIDARLSLLTWMVGFLLGLQVLLIGLVWQVVIRVTP
jgi:hypothetical protein